MLFTGRGRWRYCGMQSDMCYDKQLGLDRVLKIYLDTGYRILDTRHRSLVTFVKSIDEKNQHTCKAGSRLTK
jgi:hypothetical protein